MFDGKAELTWPQISDSWYAYGNLVRLRLASMVGHWHPLERMPRWRRNQPFMDNMLAWPTCLLDMSNSVIRTLS
jgi:hypothetical protein